MFSTDVMNENVGCKSAPLQMRQETSIRLLLKFRQFIAHFHLSLNGDRETNDKSDRKLAAISSQSSARQPPRK